MNNTGRLIVIALIFALLIGGASVLYTQLSKEEAPDQLVILPTRPTQPTKPTTQPTEPATQPTEPPTQPTEPPTEPTEPPTQPTEPPTQPAEPPTEPTEPPTQPTEPPTQPTEPPTQPTEPPTQPTEPPTQPTEPPRPTGSAPDFVVYDANGNQVRLSDFFGKPIVLNFWASWCGPCRSEMPHFQEMYEKWGDEVVFLMVNVTGGGNDTQADAMSFIQSGGYTFPVFFDLALDGASAYGVTGFPTTYFINANGDPVTYAVGALSAATLQRGIDMIR